MKKRFFLIALLLSSSINPKVAFSQSQTCQPERTSCCQDNFNNHINQTMGDFYSDVRDAGVGLLGDPSFYKDMFESYTDRDLESLFSSMDSMSGALEAIQEAESDRNRSFGQIDDSYATCMAVCGC